MALIEMLEAPIPLIVGLTQAEYNMIIDEQLLENEMDSKIWIHLNLVQDNQGQFMPLQIENLNEILN
jgi:hypothetical protein